MYKDIIEESWLYQKNLQKGVEKERQETLQQERAALLCQGRWNHEPVENWPPW